MDRIQVWLVLISVLEEAERRKWENRLEENPEQTQLRDRKRKQRRREGKKNKDIFVRLSSLAQLYL